MKEKPANDKARDRIKLECPHVWIKKINDRMTKGIPDTVLAWSGFTSWLEFKMLLGNESVHNELDELQLVNLVRLEQQTHRAWVVAYRASTRTIAEALTIYRPTALLHKTEPDAKELSSYATLLRDLRTFGVARFGGFNHGAVAELIKQTHTAY